MHCILCQCVMQHFSICYQMLTSYIFIYSTFFNIRFTSDMLQMSCSFNFYTFGYATICNYHSFALAFGLKRSFHFLDTTKAYCISAIGSHWLRVLYHSRRIRSYIFSKSSNIFAALSACSSYCSCIALLIVSPLS